ncbi:RNA polymerase subunit sigma [Archangium violaceum]|uniref:SIR2 family NAD-dependent protein deacylase n=1 Tax=Archangium violaceum TaxID=83451 RepID=UPI00195082B9|nr:Sir2 family NAD-dependent protein deacetylase [Archangium violaceum]QRN93608.1 RNA polymerase subunit sigma [Archangium violaceum]
MSTSKGVEEFLAAVSGPLGEALLVVTGAGVSLASGLPTFRGTDPGAVWANDVMEKGTLAFFRRAPEESWLWYLQRFERARGARPNEAHLALAEWERWQERHGREFLLVTQNIDTLHEQAGSRALVKVHGSLDQARCTRRNCANGPPSGTVPMASVDFGPLHADPSRETVPRCPLCRSRLRPHVLWFDELYTEHEAYQFERVLHQARKSSLIVFVGTSFSVGVTARISALALKRRIPVFSIDPAGTQPAPHIQVLAERAEVLLPRVVASSLS